MLWRSLIIDEQKVHFISYKIRVNVAVENNDDFILENKLIWLWNK